MTKRNLTIFTVIFAAVLGLTASAALACPWDGYWNGYNGGYYTGDNGAAYQEFVNETAPIREKLAAKNAELNALMAQKEPDPKRAGEIQAEITRLHNQLRQKAQAYNIAPPGAYGNQMHRHQAYCRHSRGCW